MTFDSLDDSSKPFVGNVSIKMIKKNIPVKFGFIRFNRFAEKEIINDDRQQTPSNTKSSLGPLARWPNTFLLQ